MSNEIIVEEPKIKNGTLISHVKVPTRVKRYFDSDKLYIRYENVPSERLESLSPSILNIPVVANMAHFAWMKGIDIHVEELDKEFSESLREIGPIVKRMYPSFKLSEINVNRIIQNHSSGKKVGLLFTGGVDSLSSYLKHRDEKPLLIKINLYEDLVKVNKIGKERSAKSLSDFAKNEGIEIVNVETNIDYFLVRTLLHASILLKYERNWWSGVSHSLSLLGICAPITVINDVNKMLISSSHSRKWKSSWGSLRSVDNKIRWADINVLHNNYELSRQEKIRFYLRDFLTKEEHSIKLLSCDKAEINFTNCNQCEKCLRTIVGLTLEGIDPNNVGFKTNAMTFKRLKYEFSKNIFKVDDSQYHFWEDMKEQVKLTKGNLNTSNYKELADIFSIINYAHMKRGRIYYIIYSLILFFYGNMPKRLRAFFLMVYRYL
jgi:hypothetical protein